MKKPSIIEFDGLAGDYIIDGRPLLKHLARHEKIDTGSYQVAIGCQPEVVKRLSGSSPPDLQGRWIAIYLCGMCGGYDGIPIGMRISERDHCVVWSELGRYDDYEEGCSNPFNKVREYVFDKDSYDAFLEHAKHYE